MTLHTLRPMLHLTERVFYGYDVIAITESRTYSNEFRKQRHHLLNVEGMIK